MKYFKSLIIKHIKSSLPNTLVSYKPTSLKAKECVSHLKPLNVSVQKWQRYFYRLYRLYLSIQHSHFSNLSMLSLSTWPPPYVTGFLFLWQGLVSSSVHQDWQLHLQHHHTKYRHSPRLCAQSAAVCTADSWLCCPNYIIIFTDDTTGVGLHQGCPNLFRRDQCGCNFSFQTIRSHTRVTEIQEQLIRCLLHSQRHFLIRFGHPWSTPILSYQHQRWVSIHVLDVERLT